MLSPHLAAAQNKSDERSQLFDQAVACRKIADSDQRLACYDRTVGALDAAQKKDEVYIVDRDQVHKARKSLFGFSLPKIKLFGGDKDQIDHITTIVTGISHDQNNRMIFTVKGGAKWHQIGDRVVVGVRPGTQVTIKTAAFGSYFADFKGSSSMRVQRVK
ncbi:hypothetical protein [Stakelama sediminis]|uniref:hypothetical protein n=1 Tax=Stakelama sediminis TaxID=463200 RepID=UPI0016191056|nr:hypothetical protein [Stakelama sediminis]